MLSVLTIGTFYLSMFYVFWCHVRGAIQSVLHEFHEMARKKPLIACSVYRQIEHHDEAWRVIGPYMGKFMLINANFDPQKTLNGGLFTSAA